MPSTNLKSALGFSWNDHHDFSNCTDSRYLSDLGNHCCRIGEQKAAQRVRMVCARFLLVAFAAACTAVSQAAAAPEFDVAVFPSTNFPNTDFPDTSLSNSRFL
jgi:hypothetical protein